MKRTSFLINNIFNALMSMEKHKNSILEPCNEKGGCFGINWIFVPDRTGIDPEPSKRTLRFEELLNSE